MINFICCSTHTDFSYFKNIKRFKGKNRNAFDRFLFFPFLKYAKSHKKEKGTIQFDANPIVSPFSLFTLCSRKHI